MADAVTYADLRFAEISQQEMKLDDALEENTAEDGDAMYENVTCPPRVRTEPAAPPTGAGERLRTGFRARAPLLWLLLSLLSLILMASTIGLAVKYLHVSSELQALATSHQAMNDSLMKNLTALQYTEHRVKQLTEGTQELASSLQKTKDELQTQRTMKNQTQMELERLEKMLSEERAKLYQWERDICQENWILVGRKCLFITKEEKSWTECDEFCKRTDANLIVVQRNDLTFKAFLSNNTGESWVGKEFRWKENGKTSWEWPYKYWNKPENCWHIRNGNLMQEKCSERKMCICENNLVPIKITKHYSYETPQFTLWDTNYYCSRKW